MAMSEKSEKLHIFFDRELTEFFPVKSRMDLVLDRRASIKDIIESTGIPHTEVGRIEAENAEVDFSYIPGSGQQIGVSSVVPPLDVTRPSALRPHAFEDIRFIVDVNVARLAPLLRIMGYDTVFDPVLDDEEIAAAAWKQKRIVLTRDRGLLKRSMVQFGRLLRNQRPDRQIREVVSFFGLKPDLSSALCPRCNHPLEKVDKEKIVHRLLPKTRKYYDEFTICPVCKRIYWKGSHWEKLLQRLKTNQVLE